MQKKISMPSLCVTDDDELFKRIIKMNLVRTPVFKHVLYFDTGLPLIKYLKENRSDSSNLPDVLFLDLAMPVCSGWEVLRFLETAYSTFSKQISIYIVSVSIDPRDIERALRYDFVKDFIHKPLHKEQLIAFAKAAKAVSGLES